MKLVGLALGSAASILPLLAVTLATLHDEWKRRRDLEARWRASAGEGAPLPMSLVIAGVSPPGSRFDIDLEDVNGSGKLDQAISRLGDLAWTDVEAQEPNIQLGLKRLPISRAKQRAQSGEITGRDFALAWLLRRLVVVSGNETLPDRLRGLADKDLEPMARPMAEALRRHRLLTCREDGSWWLVHQAVLASWPRAAEWRSAERQIFSTVAAMEMDRQRWLEETAAGEADTSRWLWTRERQIKLVIDWMTVRGPDDNPELAAFAREGMISAVRRDGKQAGRILLLATYFNDAIWARNVLEAAGEDSRMAANALMHEGSASALNNACSHGNPNIVRMLLEAGANSNLVLSTSLSPLDAAATVGAANVCELLLTAGAKVNYADSDGWTPLMRAARNGHEATVLRLIAAGARAEDATSRGRDCAHVGRRERLRACR